MPCVVLGYEGDSVELDTTEVKEKVSSSIPVPSNITTNSFTWDSIILSWITVEGALFYQIETDGSKFWGASTTNTFTKRGLLPETEHSFRVRTVCKNEVSEWSSVVKGRTQKELFETSGWKECPDYVDWKNKYSLNEKNPKATTKAHWGFSYCTIIGNTPIPQNKAISWSIKILKSKNNGDKIYIGVVPSDIDQNEGYNYNKYGWYLNCYTSTLWSGPPHNYRGKEYGLKKYAQTGDNVGVVMDTTKGELSFVLSGVNLGIAFDGIPLDKPLVPCALLSWESDSVELDTTEVSETKMNSSIPVPSSITTKSITWDSITLSWDAVKRASLYQIEVDGSKFWGASTTNTFAKRGLIPETEHSFRVRAVCGNEVSEWSGVAKGRTQKESFEASWWKECPDDVDNNRKYSVNERNPRVATKINYSWCTIIGNTPLSHNKVTSWYIKILKPGTSDESNIYIGVAPSDINQNEEENCENRGWYFCCWSTLRSGPPHNYRGKEYGPRKGKRTHIHTGDSVGVVTDTTKGELSFVVNSVNLGVGYDGVPLDKPLVPCVILWKQGDSVELDTTEVKETKANSSIPVPSNITTKSTTWDSITLSWDTVEGASFYQIEVDRSRFLDVSATNTFTKTGLLPDTEHSFRVRTVCGNEVSEWSGVVKGTTHKTHKFSECVWKECPDGVYEERKYSVDEKKSRIVTKINSGGLCTVIGNTPLPQNKASSWSIKILKSKGNDGNGIYIGAAPSDINQIEYNCEKCGWYFNCYKSTLCSGPPHNYRDKEYGPRKERWTIHTLKRQCGSCDGHSKG